MTQFASEAELSPRFLADLEAGRGNISVMRLAKVAAALNVTLMSLFCAGEDVYNEENPTLRQELSSPS